MSNNPITAKKPISRGGRQLIISFPDSPEITNFIEGKVEHTLDQETSLIYHVLDKSILVKLPEDESHHAIKVLRLKEGEILRLIDPEKQIIAQGSLRITNKTAQVEINILAKQTIKYPTIAIGMPEQKTAELCIEKITEMGASGIYFFIAQHTQIHKIDLVKTEQRFIKKRNAAVKQSYSLNSPDIKIFKSLESLIDSLNKNAALYTLFSPKDSEILDQNNINLEKLAEIFSNKSKAEYLFIGPEGGFSLQELQLLLNSNSKFLSLGNNTLRVETAASLAIAAFNSI